MTDKALAAIRLPPEVLRTLATYDPVTGLIYWLPRSDPRWDSRHAGKLAFHQMDKGYFGGRLGGRNYKAHRIAWTLHYGEWPSGDLDHINGVRSDNRIKNLRIVSPAENAKNLRGRLPKCHGWKTRNRDTPTAAKTVAQSLMGMKTRLKQAIAANNSLRTRDPNPDKIPVPNRRPFYGRITP